MQQAPSCTKSSFYFAWPLKKVKVKLPIRDRGPFSDAASFVGEDEDWKCVSRCPTKYPEKEIKSCISAPHIPHFSPTSSILQWKKFYNVCSINHSHNIQNDQHSPTLEQGWVAAHKLSLPTLPILPTLMPEQKMGRRPNQEMYIHSLTNKWGLMPRFKCKFRIVSMHLKNLRSERAAPPRIRTVALPGHYPRMNALWHSHCDRRELAV